eukprot:jgi/Undpi1/12488/HiC_scaffold_5.g02159.m1
MRGTKSSTPHNGLPTSSLILLHHANTAVLSCSKAKSKSVSSSKEDKRLKSKAEKARRDLLTSALSFESAKTSSFVLPTTIYADTLASKDFKTIEYLMASTTHNDIYPTIISIDSVNSVIRLVLNEVFGMDAEAYVLKDNKTKTKIVKQLTNRVFLCAMKRGLWTQQNTVTLSALALKPVSPNDIIHGHMFDNGAFVDIRKPIKQEPMDGGGSSASNTPTNT